jgi:hypothetical protein
MSDEFFDYENQEPKNNLIAFLLIISCIFIVATLAFLSWMFTATVENEQTRKQQSNSNYVDLQNLRKNEDAKLSEYQYVDREKGLVRIPVERAMQLMVEEAKGAAPKTEPASAKPEAMKVTPKVETVPAAKPEAAKAEHK